MVVFANFAENASGIGIPVLLSLCPQSPLLAPSHFRKPNIYHDVLQFDELHPEISFVQLLTN